MSIYSANSSVFTTIECNMKIRDLKAKTQIMSIFMYFFLLLKQILLAYKEKAKRKREGFQETTNRHNKIKYSKMRQSYHIKVGHCNPREGKESHKNTKLITIINTQTTNCRPVQALGLLFQSLRAYMHLAQLIKRAMFCPLSLLTPTFLSLLFVRLDREVRLRLSPCDGCLQVSASVPICCL